MQFDSIAENSYRSFLQYYQAALGIHLSKTLRYVYLFFIVQIKIYLLYKHVCVSQVKLHEKHTRLFYIVFYLKATYMYLRTLNLNIIQSSLTLRSS